MPDCHHCDATFADDEGLAAHLASAHEWEELGRIDRKRVEVLLPEEVPQDETEPQLDDITELDALLDRNPTVDVVENALAEHERLISIIDVIILAKIVDTTHEKVRSLHRLCLSYLLDSIIHAIRIARGDRLRELGFTGAHRTP